MRKTGLIALAAIALLQVTSCSMGSKVEINGEKVELEDGIYAKFQTTKGDILVEFNTEKAPMTSANFILLAEGKMPEVKEEYKDKPYYDGLTFHRVIPGFMIQGGDPEGNGSGGPGYQFPNEVSEELPHEKGVISMANSGPNTNGSQFFITVENTQQLNGGYSVFGKVLEGQSVADSISLVERDPRDKPNTDMVMTTVSIIRVGSDFKNWDALAAFEKGKADFDESQRAEQERIAQQQEEARLKSSELQASLAAQYPNAKTSESGLMYIIEDEGKGSKIEVGQEINIHYAGYFADGKILDTSIKSIAQKENVYDERREPYAPLKAVYGPQGQLIEGMKEGMTMLNVGGKAKFIIPPHLAWGEQGRGGMIPPFSWVIFDVEIVSLVE